MTASLPAVLLVALLQSTTDSGSRTIVGNDNQFLADGANALLTGDYAEGVRLTEIGLRFARNERERSNALSNLCAGLIRMEQFELALDRCNEALKISPDNHHAYSNKANVLLNLERLSEAEQAVEAGLELAPNSRILLRVLDAVRASQYRTHVTISDDS